MKYRYYVADAFTDCLFGGNPAGICLLDRWLDESVMQNVAAENNLAETAFLVPAGGEYELRWFTPEVEIDLCGHATLASAFILANFTENPPETMVFHTKSGALTVTRRGPDYEMDFPSRPPEPVPVQPAMGQALGAPVLEAHQSRDLLLLLESEQQVRDLKPDLARLASIAGAFAYIVTARGDEVDFVSRFFAPNAGIPEDPVTGSSHSTLIPFWARRLGRTEMKARQLSKRGGELGVRDCGERVRISGRARLYLEGFISVE